jgi:hypothetical protein
VNVGIIRLLRLFVGGSLLAIGFVIIDKTDLLELVNNIKERLQNDK